MLVLSRKIGEKIYLGDNICITLVDIKGDRVKIGLECPPEVIVQRQELLPLEQQWSGRDPKGKK